jgi:hypothetical protein
MHYDGLMEKIDEMPKAAWIALVVLGFIVFWPVGLALLIYLKWSGRMSCWKHGHYGRWHSPEDRDAARADWRAKREEWRAWKRQRWGNRHSSGNVAFDEYREETLRKLDEEQREFRDYLDRLRSAKDRAEFDQFMTERRNRPPATEPPPPAPTAGY